MTLKTKNRFTNKIGVPKVRTQIDPFTNEEINNQKGLTNDVNRTELVRKKHETKNMQGQRNSNPKSKETKNENKNTKN